MFNNAQEAKRTNTTKKSKKINVKQWRRILEDHNSEFKKVSDIGCFIRGVIEKYYSKTITWEETKKKIESIMSIEKNRGLVFQGDDFRKGILRSLGKKRKETLIELLNEVDSDRYGTLIKN